MGGSFYDRDADVARVSHNTKTGKSDFTHDSNVRSGKASSLHPSMDIKLKGVREARDSKSHPVSVPIAVFFDQTGSMGEVPKVLVNKLPTLMSLLLKENYVPDGDPAILYGCIGDCRTIPTEKAPLQVGEFESGNEMVDSFANMYLEGKGGGQKAESYDLALYVAARKFETDHFIKRRRKGYLFIIGDELYYPLIRKEDIVNHIGDGATQDIPITQIFNEASEKFEIFFIMPKTGFYWNDKEIHNAWKNLVGPERFIMVEDPTIVAEVIASTIGMMEGITTDRLRADLQSAGVSSSSIDNVTKSLSVITPTTTLAKSGSGNLPDVPTGPPGIKKI